MKRGQDHLAAENARLKRELHKAEMERDILKKAALAIGLGPCMMVWIRPPTAVANWQGLPAWPFEGGPSIWPLFP